MPQNPFLIQAPQTNPFLTASQEGSNPFMAKKDAPFDPTVKPEKNAIGKAVDPLVSAGKTAVGTILDVLGRPQSAAFGAILEGTEGFKKGLTGEKYYQGTDFLTDEPDSTGKTLKGLAIDLVADPLNLLGVGAIRKGYQAGVKGAGALADKGIRKVPVVNKAYGAVESFIDPHSHLKGVEGLKDFARLKESEGRFVQNQIAEDVASVLSKGTPIGAKADVFTSTFDDPTLKKIAYAIDQGQVATLTPDEQLVAQKFTKILDEQWDSELFTGHQGQPLTEARVSAKGKITPGKPPAVKVENYVPYVTKPEHQKPTTLISDIRGTSRFSKPRTFNSLTDAVTQGNATDNLGEMLHARLSAGRMAQHGSQVLDEAIGKWGTTTPQTGYRKLNIPQDVNVPQARKGALQNSYVPNDVADYLERAHVMFNKPEEVANAYRNAVRTYKSWLVANPQQLATNLLGNIVNATMTGNTPNVKNMARSAAIVLGKKVPPAIGPYSGDEILNAMKRYEIVGGQGQYHDIFNKGKNYSLNPLNPNFAWNRMMQFTNQHFAEEPFKVAQFLQSIEDGADLEQAALKVKNTFFDYAELSDSAKFLRDTGIVPFITWQTKNIPLQLENLALRPQKFAQTESLYNAATEEDQIVPHQDIREGLLPIEGNKTFRFASPINDLNKIPLGDYTLRDMMIDTIGQSAPWLKAPVELGMNQRLYNQMPIFRENSDGTVPYDAVSQLAQKLGLDWAAGIGPGDNGYPRQNELAAYILQQNPWQYYGRNFLEPPQELVDKGAIEKKDDFASVLGSLTGFRQKELSPKKQQEELERRMKMILEP